MYRAAQRSLAIRRKTLTIVNSLLSSKRSLPHDWFPEPLPDNVFIGERSWCYSTFSFLHFRSRRPRALTIGNDTGVYHGCFFDLGTSGEVQIGNFCSLVGAIISTNARVEIADYALIAHEVVLADSSIVQPCRQSGAVPMVEPETVISIGENCWIGARAILLAGARIGAGSIVAAGAVVDFEVPPCVVVAGNPAKIKSPITFPMNTSRENDAWRNLQT
jgi:acetyltransferase-like isoleucine patch superfamily enzyme